MQYYHSYNIRNGDDPTSAVSEDQVARNSGKERVPSQAYHDLSVRYRFSTDTGIATGLEIGLGIKNVFYKRPPAIGSLSGLGISGYGDPGLRRYSLFIKKTI